MKKSVLFLSAIAFISSSWLLTGCSTDDTTAPVIQLNGANPMSVSLNTSVSDPGAVAEDDEDGSVTVTSNWSTTNPNVNLKGQYTVTYTATDEAGNVATLDRIVNVVNDAEFLAGNFINAYDTCQSGVAGTFNANLTTSNTDNNAFTISNFGGFGTTVNINGTRSGNTLSFTAPQSLGSSSSLVAGNGTITSSTSPVVFDVTYTWTDGSRTEICMSHYSR